MLLPLSLTIILALLAAAHGWWALGRIWPAASEADLAHAVIGDGRVRMPPPWQCTAVAAALAVVAAWPWAIMTWPASPLVLIGSIVIGAIFFIRGSAGYSPALARAGSPPSRSGPVTSTSTRRSALRWAWRSSSF